MFRVLPSALIVLIIAMLALHAPRAVGKQCKLVYQGAGSYRNPAVAHSPNGSPPASTTTWLPFNYGADIVRGVNLGGWFVLEPWITPSLFEDTGNNDIVDEYTFGQIQDQRVAQGVLKSHWSTWITEDDFKAIKAAGLNHVRIPFGYWSVPITSADTAFDVRPDPYIPGAWPYLLNALRWARTYDIHGAPGSQNGYDNSGQRLPSPDWASNGDNVAKTLDILRFVVKSTKGLVDVIELLNEPAGFESDGFAATVRQFWQDGYGTVRQTIGSRPNVMIGDAFLGVDLWQGFLTPPDAQGVLMDYHEYQIFSVDELARSFDDHINFVCQTLIPSLTSFAAANIWTIVGEWSTAPTDCTKWLNGRGSGSRWDGTWYTPNTPMGSCQNWTGSSAGFSDSYRTFLRRYWEVQVELGERVQGWIYWTWKAENSDEWSYQKGLEGGWIPQDPNDREYPNICQP